MNARLRLGTARFFCRLGRSLASFLLAAAVIWVGAAPAHADMEKIRQSGSLKVALYKGLPPFSDNVGGQFTGSL